jgi:hypothetical protein
MPRGRRREILGLVGALVLIGALTTGASGRHPAASSSCALWTLAQAPIAPNGSELTAATAPGPNDAWAVGLVETTNHNGYGLNYTLAEHWNGSAWSIVPTQTADSKETESTQFDGVAAISGSDIWAVGQSHSLTGTDWIPLAEHFDGSSWSVVPTPPVSIPTQFEGVAAVASDDVWAVGYASGHVEPFARTVIEHWDGTAWSVVPSPNPGVRDDSLDAVTALSKDDVLAVGTQTNTSLENSTLVEHWNGRSWKVVPSPNVPSTDDALLSVAGTSSHDVWAAGFYYGAEINDTGLFEHWNGSEWTIVDGPADVAGGYRMFSVAPLAATIVVAVGERQDSHFALALEWNGGTWALLPTQSPNPSLNVLSGVAIIPGTTNVWAVGSLEAAPNFQGLIERSC